MTQQRNGMAETGDRSPTWRLHPGYVPDVVMVVRGHREPTRDDALPYEQAHGPFTEAQARAVCDVLNGASSSTGSPTPDEKLYNVFVAACRADIEMEQSKRRYMHPERVRRLAGAMRAVLGERATPPKSTEPIDETELVQRFSVAMAERLRYNRRVRGKSGWQSLSPKQLLRRASQELTELARSVEVEADALTVADEAADVGNFCAMLATNYEYRAGLRGGTPAEETPRD